MRDLDGLDPRLWPAAQHGKLPRVFALLRAYDVSGMSGTGVVAMGVQLPSGACVIEWLGPPHGINIYRDLAGLAVHEHGGATTIVWADEDG